MYEIREHYPNTGTKADEKVSLLRRGDLDNGDPPANVITSIPETEITISNLLKNIFDKYENISICEKKALKTKKTQNQLLHPVNIFKFKASYY